MSDPWVASINAALNDIVISVDDEVSVRAAGGDFCVVQRSGDDAHATITVLDVKSGRATFSIATSMPDNASVTVLMSDDDAHALHDGSLTIGDALASGRIKVRGDLSVLVAAQAILRQAMTAVSRAT